MNNDNRFGIQIDTLNMWYLMILGFSAVTAAVYARLPLLQTAATTTAFGIITGILTFRSRTILEWAYRALTYRRGKTRGRNKLYDANGIGMSWNATDRTTCAYIEVLPQPYEITTIAPSGSSTTIRPLPIDDIRQELTQFDINCASITVVNFGYKYVDNNQLADISRSSLGPVPALLHGRTFIEVAINMSQAYKAIRSRILGAQIPAGIRRTVRVATERVSRRIASRKWKTKVLNCEELAELDQYLAAAFAPALQQQTWSSAGPREMRAMTFTPSPEAWNTGHYRRWNQLDTPRQAQIIRLTRDRFGDRAQSFITFLTPESADLKTVGAVGLRREYSQQSAILTAAVPSVRTMSATAVLGKRLAPREAFPFELHPGGIGTFFGYTKDRHQVFVNFTQGATREIDMQIATKPIIEFDPFYIVAPAAMCQQKLLGLATSGQSIVISIDGEPWKEFAHRIGATYVAPHGSPKQDPAPEDDDEVAHPNQFDCDVIVAGKDNVPVPHHAGQVCIVWTTSIDESQTPITYGVIAGPQECTLRSGKEQVKFAWTVTSAEEGYFTILPRHAARTA